jgi:hypothetical protein
MLSYRWGTSHGDDIMKDASTNGRKMVLRKGAAAACTAVQRNATPEAGPAPAQLLAIAALVGGATNTAAAAAAGVDRSTLYRWSKTDADFVAELNRARGEHAAQARADLRRLAADAVATIRDLMTSETVPPAIRLKAAGMALEAAGAASEPCGPTDPDEIRTEWARTQRDKLMQNILNSSGAPNPPTMDE